MKIEELYQLFLKSKKVTTDSRIIEKNALFFALKGENFNGNAYAEKALANGCAFAIIDEEKYYGGEKYILVDNVLESLQKLSNSHRKQINIPIIAITGTNGKTTTKELISSVLSKKFNVVYTKGNLNNHIGVPLTLLSMDADTQLGVVEMGANHVGEIAQLCNIAEPDYGLITNIGKAHLEGFGSFENIIKTKTELYNSLQFSGGKAFYNLNNDILRTAISNKKLEAISYGGDQSDVKGEIISSDPFLKMLVEVEKSKFNINTRLIGSYNFENVLAAVTVGHYFEVDTKEIILAIEEYIPKNNRSQYIKTSTNSIYLDAYNANPTSVNLSVKNFASLKHEKSCVILGDMLELGDDSESEHLKIIDLLKTCEFDQVMLVGENYSGLKVPNTYLQFMSVNDLQKWLLDNKIVNSSVLIKGSRGIQLETVVKYL